MTYWEFADRCKSLKIQFRRCNELNKIFKVQKDVPATGKSVVLIDSTGALKVVDDIAMIVKRINNGDFCLSNPSMLQRWFFRNGSNLEMLQKK